MTKQELIKTVTEKTELQKKDVELTIATTLEAITEVLQSGDKVALQGFGTFEVRDRAARTGRNPQSGEQIEIPASKVPAFKPAKTLKDAVK